jgi:diacylglycerol kinase (ATP)
MNKRVKIVFIINPIAGKRRHKNIQELLSKNLNSEWDPVFIETKYSGHGGELVMEFVTEGVNNFVAVGGDGTVSEIATAAVKTGSTLGIIPCGSGNGLARSLKIPMKPEKAMTCINQNLTRKIDIGTINQHYFFCTCGVGFDAKIGRKFAKQDTRGFNTYVKTTVNEFLKYKAKKYKLKIDGKKLNRKAFLVTVANAGQYGNNAYIAPKALLNDGLFEVCIFKPFPFYKSLFLGLRLFFRNIDKSKYLEIHQGKSIVFRKNKIYSFHIDGDPIKIQGPVRVDIVPQALQVFAP